MYNKSTNFDENRKSHFLENENFKIFLTWTTHNFGGRSKKEKKREREKGNLCKGTPDIEYEQDRSVGLGATLRDRQKIKN